MPRERLNKVTHSVRASQAVISYGVGAMVDFPDQTLMTAAPKYWENSVVEIHDERLEKCLNVDYFGMPGNSDEFPDGVSYVRFPEWYFCPKCRGFKPLSKWVDEYKKTPGLQKQVNDDPNMVKHVICPKCRQELVVARIVTVCGHGHIDDFPWIKWVHAKNYKGDNNCHNPSLRFITSASSSEGLEGLTIECTTCGARATLKGAFDSGALKRLEEKTNGKYIFSCTGRHPWKNTKEECSEYPKVMQRGGSSVYFPIIIKSLVIPPYSSRITKEIEDSEGYKDLRKAIREAIKTAEKIITLTPDIKENIIKDKIDEYASKIAREITKDEKLVKDVLDRKWNNSSNTVNNISNIKYKAEEYAALSGEITLEDNSGEFLREATDISEYNIPYVKNISLIHKIKEVQVLKGFSRIEPIDFDNQQSGTSNNDIRSVEIKERDDNWYPGYEVRGEGIFIEIDEDEINHWRTNNQLIQERADIINNKYANSYYGAQRNRTITPKFLMLHTLAHLLMKQLSFECGYSIASIKERIYCSEPNEGKVMSGILIYTASGDSEGTLGGLVRQGRPDVLPEIFYNAIESAITCSNDPVCSLSQGQGRDSLNLAACYSCTLVPETSCEEFNVFLDRGCIVGTFENPNIGFYSGVARGNTANSGTIQTQIPTISGAGTSLTQVQVSSKGIDYTDCDYKTIWENLLQFSQENNELNLIESLIEHAEDFVECEKPYGGSKVLLIENMDQIDVDLLWENSKLLIFTSDNKDEYEKAVRTDWKCILLSDDSIKWEEILNSIEKR